MNEKRVQELIEQYNSKDTSKLVATWVTNNRLEWTEEAFEAIKRVLISRGEPLPEQRISERERARARARDSSYSVKIVASMWAEPEATHGFSGEATLMADSDGFTLKKNLPKQKQLLAEVRWQDATVLRDELEVNRSFTIQSPATLDGKPSLSMTVFLLSGDTAKLGAIIAPQAIRLAEVERQRIEAEQAAAPSVRRKAVGLIVGSLVWVLVAIALFAFQAHYRLERFVDGIVGHGILSSILGIAQWMLWLVIYTGGFFCLYSSAKQLITGRNQFKTSQAGKKTPPPL
jgi:hypothetical protein